MLVMMKKLPPSEGFIRHYLVYETGEFLVDSMTIILFDKES